MRGRCGQVVKAVDRFEYLPDHCVVSLGKALYLHRLSSPRCINGDLRGFLKFVNFIFQIVTNARAGFMAGKTRTKEARRRNLEGILQLIKNHSDDMIEAQRKDLHKPSFETIIGEVEMAKAEATDFLQRLDEIMGKTDVNDGSLLLLRKQAFVHRDPYGVCLVIGAWNYPIQLVLVPLIGAIAAGNAVVIKPSELSPACAELFARIIPQYLDPECYPVVNGGAEVAQALLKQRFDHILYTGGCNVAKIIMRAAAENLTPVTLELGGKCPAYVDSTGDVKSAARRISWGKFMNSGQTCVAPDYVMCHETLKDKLISELKRCLRVSYGDDIKSSQDYGRMVSQRHFDRVQTLLQQSEEKVVFGGSYDRSQRYIEPTLLDNVTFDDTIMGEEIFGPILPIVSVRSAEEAIRFINSREKPLALYVFSSDKRINNRFLTETSSGNLTVNETMIHVGGEHVFGSIKFILIRTVFTIYSSTLFLNIIILLTFTWKVLFLACGGVESRVGPRAQLRLPGSLFTLYILP
ncbi:putative aldehyde dehydrogenase, dimeric NADP-preferring [Apostichopus japonicus]|uniref:Putative aldehyde dehydrogenase, dimeric NADP-preferring n=1 Tax=Stichopus japonicus TaxID=307972 RepID=A0A2G8K488_STIJA|nr:putative aldehyde dehydrogenase, dimeric NADP-preferring [Apostichopus japonicus]